MSTDELQNLASNFRLVGIGVTFVGFIVTFASHVVAERLLTSQRADKATAQKELKLSQAELQATKAKTAELAHTLAPRNLSQEQRTAFLTFVANTPHGEVVFKCVGNSKEAWEYCAALRDLFATAGFSVGSDVSMFMSTGSRASGISMGIRNSEQPPTHAGDIQKGFESIGIPAPCSLDDDQALSANAVMIYVGAKQ